MTPRSDIVRDDFELLGMLVADAENASELWTATPYWRAYCRRILRELKRSGLADFRSNQRILKGFAAGGSAVAIEPDETWKRFAWRVMERLPGVVKIVDEYKRLLRVEHARRLAREKQVGAFALEEIARSLDPINVPAGLCNGGCDDCFEWRGQEVTYAWVMHLSRIADFYARVPPRNVTSILEIGSGLGLSTLAHKALNPHLRFVVNVDIVPVVYISTQFLKSIAGLKVIDYATTRAQPHIDIRAGKELAVYQLAAWQLPRLGSEVDYFFNAFSFQEMEREVCENYAGHVLARTRRGVCLHSSVGGHVKGAGGQRGPVTLEFIDSLFSGKFAHRAHLDGFWPRIFEGDSAQAVLLSGRRTAVRRKANTSRAKR